VTDSPDLVLAAKMCLGGIVMGFASSLLGIPPSVEPAVWVVLCAAWVAIAVRRRAKRAFLVVLGTSVATGILTGTVQLALLGSYLKHNPWYAEGIAGRPMSELVPVFLGQSIVAGIILGSLGGGVAWGLRRRQRD